MMLRAERTASGFEHAAAESEQCRGREGTAAALENSGTRCREEGERIEPSLH